MIREKIDNEHNNDVYIAMSATVKANVLCDNCHTEMVYDDSGSVLTSLPPKKLVRCPKCGLASYKVESY